MQTVVAVMMTAGIATPLPHPLPCCSNTPAPAKHSSSDGSLGAAWGAKPASAAAVAKNKQAWEARQSSLAGAAAADLMGLSALGSIGKARSSGGGGGAAGGGHRAIRPMAVTDTEVQRRQER